MPKFSEIPFFALKDYFTRRDPDDTYALPVFGQVPPSGSCTLRGPNTGFTALGGYGIELYIKTSNDFYRLKGVYKVSSEDNDTTKLYSRESLEDAFISFGKQNRFSFELIPSGSAYAGSEFTRDELFLQTDEGNFAGSSIYVKKGTPIYDYFVDQGYNDFINVNKSFLYIGKLWPGLTDTSIDVYSEHFKDYVYKCLPPHNRSDNYDEFLGVAFDQLYGPTYNLLKDVHALADPFEVKQEYLMYMREMYDVPSMGGSDIQERVYLNRISTLLKRKGTYTQIYAIWRIVNDTINRLNVYERWHTSLAPSSVPYSYFEDHLYTKNLLYQEATPSGGAGHRYYRTTYPVTVFSDTHTGIDVPYPMYGSSDYAFDVDTVFMETSGASSWSLTHGLSSQTDIMVQAWDADLYNIWPATLTRDSKLVTSITNGSTSASTILFNGAQTGYAFAASADYVHTESIPSTAWSITHDLNNMYPVVDIMDTTYVHLSPSAYTIQAIDDNSLTVTFTGGFQDGYGLIGTPDYTYTQTAASASWFVEHTLDTDFNLITLYDADTDQVMSPSASRCYKWANGILVTFDSAKYGYASLKSAALASESRERIHNLSKELSTHVKIEIDLTDEPMENNSIISEDRLTRLRTLWDKFRPVARVYHYGMVIGPSVDFTGNEVPLYPTGRVEFNSKCLLDPIVQVPDCYVKLVATGTKIVNIFHGLDYEDVIVQCYDPNNNMVQPSEVYLTGPNTVKVMFDTMYDGYITISKDTTTVEVTGAALSGSSYVWDITSMPATAGFTHIPQVTDADKHTLVPDELVNLGSYPLVLFSEEVSAGYYMAVSAGTYNFHVPSGGSPSTQIMHNLNGESFQVSVFNNEDEYIYPNEISISNKDTITLAFDSETLPVSGYAIIKKTSNIGYLANYSFGSVKLGYGSSGARYNPVTTNTLQSPYPETYTIADRDIDEDDQYYYITINIDENIDYSTNGIREVGIYNDTGEILFYSHCGTIDKPLGVSLKLYYKVRKRV